MGVKGKFITFEGSEGSGKSTQILLASEFLKKKKRKVIFLREPGGVKLSEKIREMLLDVRHQGMAKECETLLYMAARAQLVDEVIAPALASGKVVLCDRFLDSTIAYQGYGIGMDIDFIERVGQFVTQDITPNVTLVFDIPTQEGLGRIRRAKDRIEERPATYHERVREGYLALARRFPKRIKVIKADRTKEEIFEDVRGHIEKIVERITK